MKKAKKIVSSASFTRAPERRKKGSQPSLAALGSPFQGKGLAWTLPPSYGRRCPEGAEVGWGKRYEKERERSSQVRRLRKHPSAVTRPAFPKGEGKAERASSPQKRKPTPPRCVRQPLPREGARVDTPSFLWKEVPRRGGGWMGGSGMKKSEGDRLKYAIYESAAIPDTKPSPRGEGGERSEPDRVLAA